MGVALLKTNFTPSYTCFPIISLSFSHPLSLFSQFISIIPTYTIPKLQYLPKALQKLNALEIFKRHFIEHLMGISNQELKSGALLDQMNAHLSSDAGKQLVTKIGLVYQLNIAPKKIGFNEVCYTVDLKKGEVKKGAYEEGKPDATLSFTDEDFLKIASGKMNPQIAFMRGALKVKGSITAAQKFTPDIFPKPAKL